MQAKTGMQKSRAGLRGGSAKAAANSQGARPLFLAHQVMETQLQDFWAMLESILDRIQLRNRLSRHAEFGIATGCAKLSFEVHAIGNKQPACQRTVTTYPSLSLSRGRPAKDRVGDAAFRAYLYRYNRELARARESGERTRLACNRQSGSDRWRPRHRELFSFQSMAARRRNGHTRARAVPRRQGAMSLVVLNRDPCL